MARQMFSEKMQRIYHVERSWYDGVRSFSTTFQDFKIERTTIMCQPRRFCARKLDKFVKRLIFRFECWPDIGVVVPTDEIFCTVSHSSISPNFGWLVV